MPLEEEIRETQHRSQSIYSGAMLTQMETASSPVGSAERVSLLDIAKGCIEKISTQNIMRSSIEMRN